MHVAFLMTEIWGKLSTLGYIQFRITAKDFGKEPPPTLTVQIPPKVEQTLQKSPISSPATDLSVRQKFDIEIMQQTIVDLTLKAKVLEEKDKKSQSTIKELQQKLEAAEMELKNAEMRCKEIESKYEAQVNALTQRIRELEQSK